MNTFSSIFSPFMKALLLYLTSTFFSSFFFLFFDNQLKSYFFVIPSSDNLCFVDSITFLRMSTQPTLTSPIFFLQIF
eukprot:m.232699 g.232699  ORF g.232699 m.232699 type:complete len:77 (+) comp15237_c2_seq2:4299-4529(+)